MISKRERLPDENSRGEGEATAGSDQNRLRADSHNAFPPKRFSAAGVPTVWIVPQKVHCVTGIPR